MKKYFVSLLILLSVFSTVASLPAVVFADPIPTGSTDTTLKTMQDAIGLKIGPQGVTGDNITIGVVLSALLPYLYTFGGMILFGMIIWGGFEMLAGAQEQKAQETGKQRLTAAAIGFILLFVSYWLAQLLQVILGINILGK